MFLTDHQKRMLNGEEGVGVRKSMEVLVARGEAEGAEKMVDIVYAHLMPADTMFFPYGRQGQWSKELTGVLTEGVTSLKVPTTMEPKFCDLENVASKIEFTDKTINEMKQILTPASEYFESIGVIPTYSALPFLVYETKFGDHVSIAESISILWFNTMFGSRCERDDGVSSLAAAITGVYPEIGVHLDQNRYAEVVIRPGSDIRFNDFGYTDWDAYSLAASRKCKEKTPVFLNLPPKMTLTQRKHLFEVIAVESGLANMHLVGITPEAPTLEAALGGKKPVSEYEITKSDMEEAYSIVNTASGTDLNYVFLGCPHVTVPEFKKIAEILDGKKIHSGVTLIVSTSRQFLQDAKDMGYVDVIERAGGTVTKDMCIAFAGTQATGTIATDSIKAAFFYTGFSSKSQRKVRVGNIEKCIESAVMGEWE